MIQVHGSKTLLQHALPQDGWYRKPFIVADYLYSNNEDIGMTPEQILTSPFVHIVHSTNGENLDPIIRSGFLSPLHEHDQMRNDQFPALYCALSLQTKDDAYSNMRSDIAFVLSLSLLKKKSWHINIKEDYGRITNQTYDYLTLPRYLKTYYNTNDGMIGHIFEEMMIHDKIPLEYVECIVVKNEAIMSQIAEVVSYTNLKVYTLEQYKSLPLIKRIKDLYVEGSYTNQYPNYCYDNVDHYREVSFPLRI